MYLGAIYDSSLSWHTLIDCIAAKGVRAVGLLSRLSNSRSWMHRVSLLSIYRMYVVHPVLEFGCVLNSGVPAYKLRPLALLEKQVLGLCLGLSKFAASTTLYPEATIPSIVT